MIINALHTYLHVKLNIFFLKQNQLLEKCTIGNILCINGNY